MTSPTFTVRDRSPAAQARAIASLQLLLDLLRYQPDQIDGVVIHDELTDDGHRTIHVRASVRPWPSQPNPADVLKAAIEASGQAVDDASFDAARAMLDAPARAAGSHAAPDLSDEPNATQAGCSSPPCSTVARERPLSGMG